MWWMAADPTTETKSRRGTMWRHQSKMILLLNFSQQHLLVDGYYTPIIMYLIAIRITYERE